MSRELPEKLDIEQIEHACDVVMKYMRAHHENEMIQAMGTICKFLGRIKKNALWIDNFVAAAQMTRQPPFWKRLLRMK